MLVEILIAKENSVEGVETRDDDAGQLDPEGPVCKAEDAGAPIPTCKESETATSAATHI